jgi:hypothetical protein
MKIDPLWTTLPFKSIVIERIPEDEGGGWDANIPDLGRMCAHNLGYTPEDALTKLSFILKYEYQEIIRMLKDNSAQPCASRKTGSE